MTLESALIPIPSEATMLFAGFKVDDGTLTLFGIVAAGVLGNLVGSWIAYAIGYYGRLELVERHRVFHTNRRYLDWADDWFNRHGDATVFFSRMLPIIRTFISLPAGIARMPFWRFTCAHPRSAAFPGSSRSASSARRSGASGMTGRTGSTTSTTRCSPRSWP